LTLEATNFAFPATLGDRALSPFVSLSYPLLTSDDVWHLYAMVCVRTLVNKKLNPENVMKNYRKSLHNGQPMFFV